MRSISKPDWNNRLLLRQIVENDRLHAAAPIRLHHVYVLLRYRLYKRYQGNPWHVRVDNQFSPDKQHFENVYGRPPASLDPLIERLRQFHITGACPMCGGSGTGTLDHYLPQAHFPEFSFFSLNLIPTCFKCNIKRKDAYIGDEQDKRPIHPYFDAAAANQLIKIQMSGPFEAPSFSVVPIMIHAAHLADALQWHIEHIIKPAGILGHCQQRWSRLVEQPVLHLADIPDPNLVRNRLKDLASMSAHIEESNNSWDSLFFDGVSDSNDAIDFLVEVIRTVI